jgi:hypothetical protein
MIYAGGDDSSALHFRVNSKRPEVCNRHAIGNLTVTLCVCFSLRYIDTKLQTTLDYSTECETLYLLTRSFISLEYTADV